MTTETDDLTGTDIHTWFSLSYCNYLVLHRTLLQSMPREWQVRFTAMLEELDAAFDHVERPAYFKVEAAEEHEYGDLTDAQRARLRIVRHEEPCTVEHDHEENFGLNCDDRVTFEDDERMDIEPDERVLITCADPVPHYNRGRAHVEPKLHATDPSED